MLARGSTQRGRERGKGGGIRKNNRGRKYDQSTLYACIKLS
jgi:hypothetical protein